MIYKYAEKEYKIKLDPTQKKTKYYCSMQNPYTDKYDTKLLTASSIEIMQRKIQKQYQVYLKAAVLEDYYKKGEC